MPSNPCALAALALGAVACGDVAESRSVQCGTAPLEIMPNGSFDDPTPPWVQDPVTPALLCGAPKITPYNGPQAACLGGTDGTMQTLSQTVALPAGAKTVTLSGQICITTTETAQVDHDTLQFELVDGATVISAIGQSSNRQGSTACQFTPFTLTGTLTGDPATATFRMRSTLDANMPTSFFLDNLSLKVSCSH